MLTWTIRADAGPLGGLEQRRVFSHRLGVAERAVVEPHPVGVVEHCGAAQRLGQPFRLVEMVRQRLHAAPNGFSRSRSWSASGPGPSPAGAGRCTGPSNQTRR